jgi:hypothetical protein
MNMLAAGIFPRVKPGDTDYKTIDMLPATEKVPPVAPWK